MGTLFSQETLPSKGPAASDTGDDAAVKEQFKSQHDGRTYKEVLCAGEESSAMSQLQEPGPAWKFCEAPAVGQVQVQERVPDESGTWEDASELP
jgi:hypothetical protein